jgi:branched-chain amino acid transport system ATP-binding protein
MLEIEGIQVYHGDLQILWDVSLRIDSGEIVSIVGANGAGKTTLLKTISGLLHPRSGRLRFLGEPIENKSPAQIVEAGISHIPEGRKLFTTLTVLENLELGAYVPRARQKRKETLARVFRLFPILEERKYQIAGTLSGGEQQMLAIGRGLMSLPRLLLLDEPSLGLAPQVVKNMFEVIKEVNRSGTTILLVEQNIFHALGISTRGYVLQNGRIVLEGTGAELLQNIHVQKAYLGL